MSDTWNIRDCFEQMRFDKGVHLGLGDIRLSIGTQDDICDLVEQHHGKPGEVARLRAENERLRNALEHYANECNWAPHFSVAALILWRPKNQDFTCTNLGYTLAQEALAGKEGAK